MFLKENPILKQKLWIKSTKFVKRERAKRASGKFLGSFSKKVANVEIVERTVNYQPRASEASERQILDDFGET